MLRTEDRGIVYPGTRCIEHGRGKRVDLIDISDEHSNRALVDERAKHFNVK